jgi:outer membrane protein assembly factor BamB
LPLTWSEQKNVKWKTPIHGKAWSSPVIWGAQIWLTTATEDGRELFALCVDRETGKILRDQKLFDVENPQYCHPFNSYASPTPVIEEGRVYVTFGSPGTACLDTRSGKVLWERRDFVCNHYRGAGSSPILWGDLLIMNFDGSDHQFVVALDKQTGQTVWRANRSVDFKDLGPDGQPQAEGDLRKAFSTPHVATLEGKSALISIGAKACYAYDPATGRELWRVEEGTSHSASTRPVVGQGLIFFPTGWSSGQLLAVQSGVEKQGAGSSEQGVLTPRSTLRGAGFAAIDANATGTASSGTELQVLWKSKRGVPRKPSVLLMSDLLFMVDDGGIASCLEAKTGREVWRERIGGSYSASPVCAEKRIYFCSEEGKTTVLKASREFQNLAENTLNDGCLASPAIAGKALFLRTKTHLYRIEEW